MATTEQEKKKFIDTLRNKNHRNREAREADVHGRLKSSFDNEWSYIHELTQNALDAGAKKLRFFYDEKRLVFEHDGDDPLEERHVHGLSNTSQSTKGLNTIGFMGIGFKSVFHRFRHVRVSGFGWHFYFKLGFKGSHKQWYDTLLPYWDGTIPPPSNGYTMRFEFLDFYCAPHEPLTKKIPEDIKHFVDDQTSLAILALSGKGLETFSVNGDEWHIKCTNRQKHIGVIHVYDKGQRNSHSWQFFRHNYKPCPEAIEALIGRRWSPGKDVSKQPSESSIIGLVPLADGKLNPPTKGHCYATLPTKSTLSLRMDIQADWFVSASRDHISQIKSPWSRDILRNIPHLLKHYLHWLIKQKDPELLKEGYKVLVAPLQDDEIDEALRDCRNEFEKILGTEKITPIVCNPDKKRQFKSPINVKKIPASLSDFVKAPQARPDLLFGEHNNIIDQYLIGNDSLGFIKWCLNKQEFPPATHEDMGHWHDYGLKPWWDAMQKRFPVSPKSDVEDDKKKEQDCYDVLFILWESIGNEEKNNTSKYWTWGNLPCCLTEEESWIRAGDIISLQGEPPQKGESKDGDVVLKVLEGARSKFILNKQGNDESTLHYLPRPSNRLNTTMADKHDDNPCDWIARQEEDWQLSDIIEHAFTYLRDHSKSKKKKQKSCVALFHWAKSKNTPNYVPFVITASDEMVALRDAFIAEPYVDKELAQALTEWLSKHNKQPISSAYIQGHDDKDDIATFLQEIGITGQLNFHDTDSGEWSHSINHVSLENLYLLVQNMNIEGIESRHHGIHTTPDGKPFFWAQQLIDGKWVLCKDGKYRKPSRALREKSKDFRSELVAKIDLKLAEILQKYGIKWGTEITKTKALRLLERDGGKKETTSERLIELLERSTSECPDEEKERFKSILTKKVRIKGTHPLDRLVHKTSKSLLHGWLHPLNQHEDLKDALNEALKFVKEPSIPETTTPEQAFAFLQDVWRRAKNKKTPPNYNDREAAKAAYKLIVADDKIRSKLEEDVANNALYLYAHRNDPGDSAKAWYCYVSDEFYIDDRENLHPQILLKVNQGALEIPLCIARRDLDETVEDEILGLEKLSSYIDPKIEPKSPKEIPTDWQQCIKALWHLLSDNTGTEPTICYYETLILACGNDNIDVSAYLDTDGKKLYLSGEPNSFRKELTRIVRQAFPKYNQPELVMTTIEKLDNKENFEKEFVELAEILGKDPDAILEHARPTPKKTEPEPKKEQPPAPPPNVPGGQATPSIPAQNHSNGKSQPYTPSSPDSPSVPQSKPHTSPSSGARGKRHTGTQLTHRQPANSQKTNNIEINPSSYAEHRDRVNSRDNDEASFRSDDEYRNEVIKYEKKYGYTAEPMDENHPGYDIKSTNSNGTVRYIEVKGRALSGKTVELSQRQFCQALYSDKFEKNKNGEYWLYIVEKNSDGSFEGGVHPIPWTRYTGKMTMAFDKETWKASAQEDREED